MTMRTYNPEEFKQALNRGEVFQTGDCYSSGGNAQYYSAEHNRWYNRRGEASTYTVFELYGSLNLERHNHGGRYSYAGENMYRSLRDAWASNEPDASATSSEPYEVPEASEEFKAELWRVYRKMAKHYGWCSEGQRRLEREFKERLGVEAPVHKKKLEIDLPVEYTTDDLRSALSKLAGRSVRVEEIIEEEQQV